jgi:hypothetical protein
MATVKPIYQIFGELNQAKNDHDRKAILFYNRSYALESVLQAIFGPAQFCVTEPLNYVPSDMPQGMGYSSIRAELDKAYLFVKNGDKVPVGLSEERKKQLMIQSLESLEAREAAVLMNMYLKKNTVDGLTKELVKDVFPHLYDLN